jgi:hypothetical protein
VIGEADEADRIVLIAPTPRSPSGQIDCTVKLKRAILSADEAKISVNILRASGLAIAFDVLIYGSELPDRRNDPFVFTNQSLSLHARRCAPDNPATLVTLTYTDYDHTAGDMTISVPPMRLDDDRLGRIQDFFLDLRYSLGCSDPGLKERP